MWEAPLEPLPESGAVRERHDGPVSRPARDLPVLRIEPADAWLLSDVLSGDELPQAVRADPAHRWIVVRFDCSFRPRAGDVTVEWARFAVELLPDSAGLLAKAEDVHPWRVERSVRRHVSLRISPSLKFQELEASLGEYGRESDYEALEPIIEAAGRGGSALSWDYSSGAQQSVSGGKRMHTLVKMPLAATELQAVVALSADLRVDRRFLWPASRQRDETPMQIRLWPASPCAE